MGQLELLETWQQPIVTWGAAALLLLLALLLAWRPWGLWRLAQRRQRLISSCGVARLDNVILEDGLGGHKVLEHILLTPQGLLVLLPRRCAGMIFGAERIDSWTQMMRGKSYHFDNPLHQLDELLATLRFHHPGIPLEGRVLFSGGCRFPKGRPERIMLLEEMGAEGQKVDQAVVPVLEDAWKRLQQQPRAEGSGDNTEDAVPVFRLWFSLALLLSSAAWLGWQLLPRNGL